MGYSGKWKPEAHQPKNQFGNAEPFSESDYEYAKPVNFNLLILFQIDFVRKALNYPPYEQYVMALKEAVDTFESMMNAYTGDDKDYQPKLEKLTKFHADYFKTLNAQDKIIKLHELRKAFHRKRFELLLELATKRGFTIIKDAQEEF